MKTFTKEQLKGYVHYDSQSQTATITGQFLFLEQIKILHIMRCVQYFKDHILEQKNICFTSNPNWPTQYLILDLCVDKKIVIESAWLREMIKMYEDDFIMQSILSDILSLFDMCDQYALAQSDSDEITLDLIPREDICSILNDKLDDRKKI